MRQVVINADDFGKDRVTTEAILQAFEMGAISQTTLMVNMPYADEAVRLAKEKGVGDRIGLHLNLVEGKPLTEGLRACRLFCDESCKFAGGGVLRSRRMLLPYKKKIAALIHAECRAQIDKYLAYGLSLMHCDSHCHAHVRIPVARILFQLLEKSGFVSVRRTYGVSRFCSMNGILHGVRNFLYANLVRRYKFKTTDAFNGFCEKDLDCGGSIEFMVHPNMSHGELVDVTNYKTGTGSPLSEIADLVREKKLTLRTMREVCS